MQGDVSIDEKEFTNRGPWIILIIALIFGPSSALFAILSLVGMIVSFGWGMVISFAFWSAVTVPCIFLIVYVLTQKRVVLDGSGIRSYKGKKEKFSVRWEDISNVTLYHCSTSSNPNYPHLTTLRLFIKTGSDVHVLTDSENGLQNVKDIHRSILSRRTRYPNIIERKDDDWLLERRGDIFAKMMLRSREIDRKKKKK